MSEYTTVAPADALAENSGMCLEVAGREIALFRVGDAFYAVDNECPHSGGPLCDGYLEGNTVMCPWHFWQFDLTNGECLTVTGFDIAIYPVRVEGGQIQLQV